MRDEALQSAAAEVGSELYFRIPPARCLAITLIVEK